MLEIKIKDAVMLIDEDDYNKISELSLCLFKRKTASVIYALAHVKGVGSQRVHRLILGITDPSVFVDHKNGNGLDNRKENLRRCTQAENVRNRRRSPDKIFGSKYKGVYKRGSKNKPWTAMIQIDYKSIYIGGFVTEVEAALAYNKAALQYHGEFAHTNEI